MDYGLPSDAPTPLEKRLIQAQTELDVLYQFGTAIHAPRDWLPLYRLLYDQARRLMSIDGAYTALLVEDGSKLQTVISIDEGIEYPPDPLWSFSAERPTGWVIYHARPIRFDDINAELPTRFPQASTPIRFGDTTKLSRGWMLVPMLINREVKGIINVQSYKYAAYGEREERLLMTLGSMLAIAVSQSHLIQQFETMRQALSAPLIPVSDQLMILPLIGELDSMRLGLVQRTLLSTVERQRIRHVVLDLTGVTEVGAEAQRRLLRLIQAVALLGATCILSGLKGTLARGLGANGVDLSALYVVRDVEQALLQFGAVSSPQR